MRAKLILILFFSLLQSHLIFTNAQNWEYSNAFENEWLQKICTQGLDTVYIVGDNGLIAKSTDRTKTWTKQYPVNVKLNDIIFCNQNIGFAVGDNGIILKTIDAGNTWIQTTSNATENINAIAATGLDNIWAVGNNSLVLYSGNSGNVWEKRNILTENNRKLLDIAFRNGLGYFIGNYATAYLTENFGNSWHKQTLVENTFEFQQLHCINLTSNKMYIMYDFERVIFSKQNGEINWINKNMPIDNGKSYFINDSVGYFIGILPIPTGGTGNSTFAINKTINGATDWVYNFTSEYKSHGFPDSNHMDICFANDTIGYAVLGAALLKTPSLSTNPIDAVTTTKANAVSILQKGSILQIISPLNKINTIEMFDIYGKRLRIQPAITNSINISFIPQGMYLILINFSDNKSVTKKYIKH